VVPSGAVALACAVAVAWMFVLARAIDPMLKLVSRYTHYRALHYVITPLKQGTRSASPSCSLKAGCHVAFDYSAPAELFSPPSKSNRRKLPQSRRFSTAAEAISFAIEQFPAVSTLSLWMQIGDKNFDSEAIRRLYESDAYPLERGRLASEDSTIAELDD